MLCMIIIDQGGEYIYVPRGFLVKTTQHYKALRICCSPNNFSYNEHILMGPGAHIRRG